MWGAMAFQQALKLEVQILCVLARDRVTWSISRQHAVTQAQCSDVAVT